MEIEQVLFPSNFLNCRIQLLGGCFKRVHTIRQLDPTQSDPTKLDRVNAPPIRQLDEGRLAKFY